MNTNVIVNRKGNIGTIMADIDKYFDYKFVAKIMKVLSLEPPSCRSINIDELAIWVRDAIKDLIEDLLKENDAATYTTTGGRFCLMVHMWDSSILVAFSPEHYDTSSDEITRCEVGYKSEHWDDLRLDIHKRLDAILNMVDVMNNCVYDPLKKRRGQK